MTARNTFGPLQTALYTKLGGDATLSGLVTGVFDEVPEGTQTPYMVIGEAYATPRNSHDRHGRRTVETIHVWSDHLGFSEANTITDRIVGLLDHQPLTVTDHDVVLAHFEYDQTIRDPDPNLRHVVLRFAFTTEQTP
jgi:hypothetical protein